MAPRALSLQAYMAYARSSVSLGGSGGTPADLPKRAPGPLVWAHSEDSEQARALVSLCRRMRLQRPEIQVLLTGHVPEGAGFSQAALPSERPSDCDAFLRAMRPDFLLWSGARLRPALLQSAREAGCHLTALAPPDDRWKSASPRWLPDTTMATLQLFDRIHTRGEAARRLLRRHGVAQDKLLSSGPLLDTGPPLDCSDRQHEKMAALLVARPIWLAARVRLDEAADVLRAHRRAVRLAHRLLLILVPQNDGDYDAIARITEAEQMRTCHWDNGGTPDENTQVLLLEGPEDLGLWYRLSPLAFLGGSLVPGHGGTDPFEAAALGTAILYGPNVGRHLAGYTRLVESGAARIVRDSDSLASAVSHLVAPDQAASMAHAGWEVVSSGAALVDQVIETIFARIDAQEIR